MVTRAWLQEQLPALNPWWARIGWQAADPHLKEAAAAPFDRVPTMLDDISPPNLYTLRGPRRTGKTTLVKQTIARLLASGIDPRRVCFFAADPLRTHTDLINLFQAARTFFPDLDASRYFLIDEVTSISEWYRGLKWLRDETPVSGDCVLVTGSSARDVRAGADMLAGRRGPTAGLDRLLLPMSFAEFAYFGGFGLRPPVQMPFSEFFTAEGLAACDRARLHLADLVGAFDLYLGIGGFPRAVIDFRSSGQVSEGFIRDVWDVISGDLRRVGLTQSEAILRLLERVARHLTTPFESAAIARDLSVSHETAASWIDALAESYVLFRLLQQEGGLPAPRKQRKVYPIDPLVAVLPGHVSVGAATPAVTQRAEAAVGAALFRAVEGSRVDRFTEASRLFLFRKPATGAEVDFLVLPDLPAEVKYVDRVSQADSRAMVANFGRGMLLTHTAVDLTTPVPAVPAAIFAWLLEQHG